jgi:hypothetical protein
MKPPHAIPARPALRLDIGELHLHGYGIEHRERFGEVLRQTLTELTEQHGAPSSPGRRAPLPPIDRIHHQATALDPESAARETAHAIWARLHADQSEPRR